MANEFNEEMTRVVTDEASAFGLACYEGEVVDGVFEGEFRGNVDDPDIARAWLKGDVVELALRNLYSGGGE